MMNSTFHSEKEQRCQGASHGLRRAVLPVGNDDKGMVSGCPLNNLIPEWNDLVYTGTWDQAYNR